jgi:hypothetical protein
MASSSSSTTEQQLALLEAKIEADWQEMRELFAAMQQSLIS